MAIHKQICKAVFNDAELFKILKAENVLIRQEANGQYRYQRNKVVLDICKEDMKNKKLGEYQQVVADVDEHMLFAFSGKAKTKGKTHYKEWVKTQAKRLKSMLKKQFRHESRLVPNRKDADEFALPVDDYDDDGTASEPEQNDEKDDEASEPVAVDEDEKDDEASEPLDAATERDEQGEDSEEDAADKDEKAQDSTDEAADARADQKAASEDRCSEPPADTQPPCDDMIVSGADIAEFNNDIVCSMCGRKFRKEDVGQVFEGDLVRHYGGCPAECSPSPEPPKKVARLGSFLPPLLQATVIAAKAVPPLALTSQSVYGNEGVKAERRLAKLQQAAAKVAAKAAATAVAKVAKPKPATINADKEPGNSSDAPTKNNRMDAVPDECGKPKLMTAKSWTVPPPPGGKYKIEVIIDPSKTAMYFVRGGCTIELPNKDRRIGWTNCGGPVAAWQEAKKVAGWPDGPVA